MLRVSSYLMSSSSKPTLDVRVTFGVSSRDCIVGGTDGFSTEF